MPTIQETFAEYTQLLDENSKLREKFIAIGDIYKKHNEDTYCTRVRKLKLFPDKLHELVTYEIVLTSIYYIIDS